MRRVIRRISLFARPRVTVTQTHPEWTVDSDVPVKMRDGVTLRVNVYRPIGHERVPVIMSAHPYGKDAVPARSRSGRTVNMQYRIMPQPDRVTMSAWTGWEAPDPAYWVQRGYAVVNADARGGGTSEGTGELFSDLEAQDYEDLIEWAGTQEWSTGKVGLDGVSYLAISQYRVAARRPAHLAAICPWEGFSDLYRDFVRPGGIRENGFSVLWSTLTARAARLSPPLRPALAAHVARDDWYAQRTPAIDAIDVPILVCGSFSDHNLHSRGSHEVFRRAGAGPDSPPRWLYTHRRGKWSTYYSPEAAAVRARFFDHFLRGIDNGWDQLPPVRLEVHEGGPRPVAVRGETSWPPDDATQRELFLDASAGAMKEDPPTTAASHGFSTRGPGLEWTWRYGADLDILGPMALRIFVEVRGCDDLHLFAGVRKVTRAGVETLFEGSYGFDRAWVSYGWQRAAHRELDLRLSTPMRPVHTFAAAEPLRAGEIVAVEIEMRDHATRLRAGDELRLVLRGTWPHSRNPFTGQLPAGYAKSPRGEVVIHTGPAHPARLLMSTRRAVVTGETLIDPWLASGGPPR